jgi:hypothetical protein
VYFSIPDIQPCDVFLPTWIFNASATAADCKWNACQVQPVIPVLTPAALIGKTSVLKALAAPEALPTHAVRTGTYLDVKQLKAVCVANAVLAPSGSGKKNKQGGRGLLKRDWAHALVKAFFPEASQEDHDNMYRGIMGIKSHVEICPEEILTSIKTLDQTEGQSFEGLTKFAEKMEKDRDAARAKHVDEEDPGQLSAIRVTKLLKCVVCGFDWLVSVDFGCRLWVVPTKVSLLPPGRRSTTLREH